MRLLPRRFRFVGVLTLCVIVHLNATSNRTDGEGPAAVAVTAGAVHDVGIDKRTPWTTSRIAGSPEPPLPYSTERVFPALEFHHPVDMANVPGSDRLLIIEEEGKVYSFLNRGDIESADLVIDLAKELEDVRVTYAITCHPDFEHNRYCYICCIGERKQENGTRIIRFRLNETDPPTIDADSAKVVITWWSGGHNGCALKFGPDGCLYISTGDGVGPHPPDANQTGQDVRDLLSSILRIDVDHAEQGRNYRIPPDNPFVDMPEARPEIWAYGLRNPWRMSFDRKTGDLWVGDVGWELWEMLIRIERGGNYGWSIMEGRQSANPEWPRGPTPILPPTIDHPHSESSSITAGVTYYGSQLPELVGAHIYGDYDTGKIWAVRWENGKVAWHRELADTTHRIVAFGEDNAGEMYLLDHIGGTLHRLATNPAPSNASAFPRRLSQTGLFSDVPLQSPAPGVIPYSVNAEPWMDGAVAERFVAVPGDSAISVREDSIGPGGFRWTFPQDAVLVKTLSWESASGETTARHRLETQILHYAAEVWRAYSYRWNDDQTDAILVGTAGEDGVYDIPDPASRTKPRRLKWHFSGRAECLRCHNHMSGSALGFQTPQLDRYHDYGGRMAPQLETLVHIGLRDPMILREQRPQLVDPHDATAELDRRARSYLHANCAHCHRTHAGGSVLSRMQYELPLQDTRMIGERPTQGTFGIPAAEVIAPGDPFRSVLLYRMSKVGGGRMPHIGSQVVDIQGIALIEDWISALNAGRNELVASARAAETLRANEKHLIRQLQSVREPNSSAATDLVDQLLATTCGGLLLLREVDKKHFQEPMISLIVERGSAHPSVSIRDLFERYLPEERRAKRLGSIVRPSDILELAGNAARGEQLFFESEGVQCKNCHQIRGRGRAIGPNLDEIGKKLAPAQLLESILEPSKVIDPKYVSYLLETRNGQVHTGLLVKKDAEEVVLKNNEDRLIRVAGEEVEQLVAQTASLMPELLVRDLTAQQVSDLIAYMSELK